MGARLDAALGYCHQGRSIIPVEPGGKLPAIPWRRYQAERASPDRIAHWWNRADWNVGLVCGQISNLVCIDVDFRHHGTGALAKLEATYGTLATAEVATPNGVHLWFSHPGVRIPNSAGLLGPGLDVRADGGFVVAPPSVRDDGAYAWSGRTLLEESDMAPLPTWLVRLLTTPAPQSANLLPPTSGRHGDRHQRYLQAAITGILNQPARARPGATDGTGRNDQLFRAAVRVVELQHQGAPESWIAIIEQAGLRLGLDQAEIAKTIQSARKRVGP